MEVVSKWYVLQVLSGKEKKVKRAIEDLAEQSGVKEFIKEVLLPTEKVAEVKGGEQRVVEKKLWPGYLLIHMDMTDESLQYVRHTNGVVGVLGGDVPTPVDVNEMLEDLRRKQDTVTQRHQFEVGNNVKIIDGVFDNFIGTVTAVFPEKGQLNVLVSIFGRDTQVEDLKYAQVEEASDDDLG